MVLVLCGGGIVHRGKGSYSENEYVSIIITTHNVSMNTKSFFFLNANQTKLYTCFFLTYNMNNISFIYNRERSKQLGAVVCPFIHRVVMMPKAF